MASTRSKMLRLRLRPREWIAWRTKAKLADKTLSEWIRAACEAQLRESAPK